jgi:hydroxypyruvate reductase
MAAVSELRAHAREIFDAGLRAADPLEAIQQSVHVDGDRLTVSDCSYDLAKFRKVSVIGAGKAAARMGLVLEELLGARIADGLVLVKYGHGLPLKKIHVIEAAHPVPDEAGLRGARQVMELVTGAGKNDLIIFLISGGGSALLPAPADGVTLEDKQRTTEALLASGATIGEVNAVRKHISKVKGGRLAQLATPATLVSLILSDVVGDSLEDIASGPTVADPSAYADCLSVIRRYSLQEKIPAAVLDLLTRGARGELDETPKPGSPAFRTARNFIVGSNRTALAAAKKQADALGYRTMILTRAVEGESRSVATSHAALATEIQKTDTPIHRPACVLAGGETTVAVRGDGLGGRNQEYALAAAMEIDGVDGVVALSAGTDGTDGPTDAAGAVVDGATIARGKAKGLAAVEFLQRNDSYHFLQATEDLLRTGPTLTNVMDLQVWLIA